MIEQALIISSLLLLIAVLASKASSRLGVPALLVFLAVGMLAGSEGPGGIPFDDASAAQSIGVVALAFILFAGGLDTEWHGLSSVLWRGLSLATVGVFVTAILVGWFAKVVLGVSWMQGLLLGSIVSSTDAAAVFSVLRSQGISLKGKLQPLLELESGSNDPMAVFLTMGFISLLSHPGESFLNLIPMFVQQMAVGAILGFAIGKAAIAIINKSKLDSDGLYPVITIAVVLLTYGVTAWLGGSGFLAVYLAGIVMGHGDFVHRRSLTQFHNALAWLMQIAMFLVLGLLVFPSHLKAVAGVGLLISVFLVFIARPISVFISLAFARLGVRHKLLISWVGLRGAVPIVLSTFPLLADIPNADLYFNVVFFIVLTSVLLQGTTISAVANRLRLQAPTIPQDRRFPLEVLPSGKGSSELAEVLIPETSPLVGKLVVEARFPRSAMVILLTRKNDLLVPKGGTTLQSGDILLILADPDALTRVRAIVGSATSAVSTR